MAVAIIHDFKARTIPSGYTLRLGIARLFGVVFQRKMLAITSNGVIKPLNGRQIVQIIELENVQKCCVVP
jgi:hypothetical protein